MKLKASAGAVLRLLSFLISPGFVLSEQLVRCLSIFILKLPAMRHTRLMFFVAMLFLQCSRQAELPPADTLFTMVPAEYSGVDFANRVQYTEELNCYTFRNFYNGGGVGLGDFNNDGLVDIFFCANMSSNRLYLNRGEFRFEDVTEKAGVGSKNVWTSGVSVADVNGDGWLDLYVMKSGPPGGQQRHNELFINNGPPSENETSGFIPTFTEQAKAYGIADEGLSVHGAFFDYDLDGDLDLYLLNNSLRSVGGYDLIPGQRNKPDPAGGNKLYRNDGGHFTNVTSEAGIYSSNIGFGLGVSVGDLNLDGWPDLFVSNDFFERDYLYLNNADGTFREVLEDCLKETSMGSMGADIADLNNDAWPDIFVTEMLPEDDRRIKTKTKFEDWDLYQREVKAGYFHQFTRNTLQINLGAGGKTTEHPVFSEISRMAGVHATDWSWGALAFDMDNDGYRDLFVANGIGKDLTDQDYVNFYSDPDNVRAALAKEGKAITQMVDAMPSEKLPNYAFQNTLAEGRSNERLPAFKNRATEWGLAEPSFSNGSAYADLDNDGDLDLVVNNQDMPAFIFRNNSRQLLPENHYLTLELIGEGANTRALGAKAIALCNGKRFYAEVAPMRGFESTVDTRLHFGLGPHEVVDTLLVIWPDGRSTSRTNVGVDQHLTLKQSQSSEVTDGIRLLHDLVFPSAFGQHGFHLSAVAPPFDFTHRENPFNDFDRDHLIFHMLSAEGPPMATGDVNGDGRPDFFVGGAKDQAGTLFLSNGASYKPVTDFLEPDKICEDSGALFFDADGDGDLDLYMASGGNEFPQTSSALLDRLYLNHGGSFEKSTLPPLLVFESTGTVAAADYDQDGDMDLFVGERLKPFIYGVPGDGYLLQNDGEGRFTDVSATAAPALKRLGMITAAAWADVDADGDPDLVLAGEYMPVQVLRNEGGKLGEPRPVPDSEGWWNCLAVADLDGDGDLDLAAGNHGLNSRFKATAEKPVTMWVNDFDQNGSVEQLVCVYNGEKSYPMVLRNDLVAHMPVLKKKYLKFNNYAEQTIEDIFTPEQLENAIRLEARTMASALFVNDGAGNFEMKPLPTEAQSSPVYAIAAKDLDEDGLPELVLGGNLSRAKPETGIYMGSYGWVLKNMGSGTFKALWPHESGLQVNGEIRSLIWADDVLIIGRNNDSVQAFKRTNPDF